MQAKKDQTSKKIYEALKISLKKEITDSIKTRNEIKINNTDNKKQEMWRLINRETNGKKKSNTGNERSNSITAGDLNGFFSLAGKGADPDLETSIGLLQHSKPIQILFLYFL